MSVKREMVNALGLIAPEAVGLTLYGRRFRIPIRRGYDRRLLQAGHAAAHFGYFARADKRCVVDIGANCGQSFLWMAARWPDAVYFGFEPNVQCAGHLERLIEINGMQRAVVFPIGLSDQNRVGALFLKGRADPSATVEPDFRSDQGARSERRVLLRAGDEFAAEAGISSVDLLKVDVEGHELAVLEGLSALIERDRPTIMLEVLRTDGGGGASREFRVAKLAQLNEWVTRAGYRVLGLNDGQYRLRARIGDPTVDYVLEPL
jgi:FkbM family methyltransferase